MADVFISYSRADYDDFVKAFVDDLRAEKIDVWIDQHSLKPARRIGNKRFVTQF